MIKFLTLIALVVSLLVNVFFLRTVYTMTASSSVCANIRETDTDAIVYQWCYNDVTKTKAYLKLSQEIE